MTALLAPTLEEEAYAFDYSVLAPNHPAVRSKRAVTPLRLVSTTEPAPALSLSWQALAWRAAFFILALVAAVVLGSLVGIGLDSSFGMVPVDYFSHTVVPGDNLWNLAAANAGALSTDEMVAQIMNANHLDAASVLTAGQEILIPVF